MLRPGFQHLIGLLVMINVAAPCQTTSTLSLEDAGPAVTSSVIEIRGVRAGDFEPACWEANTLNWVPDHRHPLMEPRPGPFRNIYAPAVTEEPYGWKIFYGAWDGVGTGNDRIYVTTTSDFLTFGERQTIVEHGDFQHVCNVTAVKHEDQYSLLCTAYPDNANTNKPAYFFSPDGIRWNGHDAPHRATFADLVSMQGYALFPTADINGMNVLARDGDRWRMFFSSFTDFGHIYRASSENGTSWTFDQEVLTAHMAPNDVKRVGPGNSKRWLMGMHWNRQRLWYALSDDGTSFSEPREMFSSLTAGDRYMVAVGFVTAQQASRVCGVLYGAGDAPTLDRNRIFARWLQKRCVLSVDGREIIGSSSAGPDTQLVDVIALPNSFSGTVTLNAEDGKTVLGSTAKQILRKGRAYTFR
jgi:hypothetical protein